jgi:hypothetical protein
MAISEHGSGSQTCTVTTEHTLTGAESEDGIFQFVLDTANLVAGDVLEVRVKEKARSSDTQRLAYMDTLSGVQGEPLWMSPSMILMHDWDFSIKQTAGTGRAIPWSIRQIA